MTPRNRIVRTVAVVAVVAVSQWALGGCGSPGAGAVTGGQEMLSPGDDSGTGGDDSEPRFVSFNEGGGDSALRLGGATFTGQAVGPLIGGSLTLRFSADGALTSMGGTLLGNVLGEPGAEVVFDYVTGTVQGAPFILRELVVNLTGDSFSARTVYEPADGAAVGGGVMTLEATLRTPSNDDLRGALRLPGFDDEDLPEFTLERV